MLKYSYPVKSTCDMKYVTKSENIGLMTIEGKRKLNETVLSPIKVSVTYSLIYSVRSLIQEYLELFNDSFGLRSLKGITSKTT